MYQVLRVIAWFNKVTDRDISLDGGKNAPLGEMIRNLSEKGVSVPLGFAITAEAYKYVVEKAGMNQKIKDALAGLDTHDFEEIISESENL